MQLQPLQELLEVVHEGLPALVLPQEVQAGRADAFGRAQASLVPCHPSEGERKLGQWGHAQPRYYCTKYVMHTYFSTKIFEKFLVKISHVSGKNVGKS